MWVEDVSRRGVLKARSQADLDFSKPVIISRILQLIIFSNDFKIVFVFRPDANFPYMNQWAVSLVSTFSTCWRLEC